MVTSGELRSLSSVETSWTLIDAAAGEHSDEEARREILARYYEPACAFLSSLERDAEIARDYAHDFFLKKVFREEGQGVLEKVDRKRRFRPYLKRALKNYWRDRKREEGRARKRAWSPADESGVGLDDLPGRRWIDADAAFDRERIRDLLTRALERLRATCEEKGEGEYVEIFLSRYGGDEEKPPSWAEIGAHHRLGEKVARHRSETASRRFGAAIRQVLTEEEGSTAAANEEIASLLESLRSSDEVEDLA